jgi:SEC-C motif
MQLVDVGRNEPCTCGSDRKYKKCCLLAREALVAGNRADLDVAALVDHAVANDRWKAVDEVFDEGFALFEAGGLLEHVRFRQDLITARTPDVAVLSRLCTAGWQRRCEQEIAYVLARYDLDPGERDGLRLAIHGLRRFGARSPLVEAVADLQAAEYRARAQNFGDTLSRLGLTLDDIADGWTEIADWIEREQPAVLLFADWFALRTTREPGIADVWLSGITGRVCDVALVVLERPDLRDAQQWAQLAAIALVSGIPRLGLVLPRITPPRVSDADEQMLYEALAGVAEHSNDTLRGAIGRIARATQARGDYAGAAMLRETVQRVQSWHR